MLEVNGKKMAMISEGIEEIGEECFNDAELKMIRIPASIKIIRGRTNDPNTNVLKSAAFEKCVNLKAIVFTEDS